MRRWPASPSSRPRSAIAGSTTGSGRTAPDAIAADVAAASSLIERAEAIDPADLDATDRVTRAALIEHLSLERDLVAAGLEPWAVDPLDGPQVTFLNIAVVPADPRWRRRGGAPRPLAGRWRRGSPATSDPRARRWPTGSSRRGRSSGASSPSSTTSSRGPVEDWPLLEPARDLPAGSLAGRGRGVSGATSRRSSPTRSDRRSPATGRSSPTSSPPSPAADDRPGLGTVPGGDAAYARLVRAPHDARPEPGGDPPDRPARRPSGSTGSSPSWAIASSGPATGTR